MLFERKQKQKRHKGSANHSQSQLQQQQQAKCMDQQHGANEHLCQYQLFGMNTHGDNVVEAESARNIRRKCKAL